MFGTQNQTVEGLHQRVMRWHEETVSEHAAGPEENDDMHKRSVDRGWTRATRGVEGKLGSAAPSEEVTVFSGGF
jgi:hypothetical protein